jgi:hypothetical protein
MAGSRIVAVQDSMRADPGSGLMVATSGEDFCPSAGEKRFVEKTIPADGGERDEGEGEGPKENIRVVDLVG